MGPHMSSCYSDIAMYKFDFKALNYKADLLCGKRFRDDVFVLWNQSFEESNKFFDFTNSIDISGKIKFILSVANGSVLEFLDLSLHIKEQNKICVHVYVKPPNSFTHVLPSTCYSKRNINNIPKSITLRLRRIFDSDEKFDMHSNEYQNYIIARNYNISLVKKQFHSVRSISRSAARQVKQKVTDKSFNLVTVYHPLVNNLQKITKNNLPLHIKKREKP